MDPCIDIRRYRELLARDVPRVTRSTLEWLMVNAVREFASAEPYPLPADHLESPRLMTLAEKAVADSARLMGSQFAAMQLYVGTQDTLLMLAYRNFDSGFIAGFSAFKPDGCTSCSRAVATGRRVAIEDIERDGLFGRHVPAALAAGFRALQSTPLKHPSGATIGVLTTHFAAPRAFANDELEQFDAHAREVSMELARACG